MEQNSFGYWLKLKRKALDLTREQLAERVGYSAATIRKIEDEERRPSVQIAERLAELFNIPAGERTSFLQFARGDWQAAPTEHMEIAPWLVLTPPGNESGRASKAHLATFLFTDIESSAKLWERAPEKMKVALQRHNSILQEAISSHAGEVFQIVGDAFCAAFPTVLAALSAGVTIQQKLSQEEWDLPFPIRVRMGIHTGEAEQTANHQYVSNSTLNRVARIVNAAHGGQVLLSLATKDLVKDALPAETGLRDMGEHYLKNMMHPEHLFQLNIAGLPVDFPALNTLTHRHNLPIQLTSFIARQEEIAYVQQYLSQAAIRLVTLMGPPGIGKTRLSIETARASLPDFPDGVFFVELAPLENPALLAVTVAQALGYMETGNVSSEQQLKSSIGDKKILMVLDNCEHLIEGVALLTSQLLSACSHLKIIATSRESLRIPGEWVYAVPAFDLPAKRVSLDMESASEYPALILFAERARAVRADFALNADNIETIVEICARLDGLPLVIELMAARMRLMTPQALLDRLSGQFVLTADGMRAASERQKTLKHAIDWSYKLLPLEEQKLFAYLSVFSGGFSLEAVEAMLSRRVSENPLPTLIALLLDKSLLKFAPNLPESSEARYTMLVTIQEYARERLQQMGEEAEIRNEHLAYFLALAQKADKELRGRHQLEWLNRLNSDRDNLRAALDWAIETGQVKNALQLVRKLHWFWDIRSNHTEARQWFHRVLEMPNVPSYPEMHAEVLAQVANHTVLQIGHQAAKPYSEQALSIARAHQDKHNTARALVMLALALTGEKDFAAAEKALEESQALFQEVQDEWGYGMSVLMLGWSAANQENWAVDLMRLEESLAIFRKLGDRHFMSVTLRAIGTAQMMQGETAKSVTAMKEALVLAQQVDSKFEIGWTLWQFAATAQQAGDLVRAVRLYEAARSILESIGTWSPRTKLQLEKSLAASRRALGEAELRTAIEQGRAMTMEQAIEYALSLSP